MGTFWGLALRLRHSAWIGGPLGAPTYLLDTNWESAHFSLETLTGAQTDLFDTAWKNAHFSLQTVTLGVPTGKWGCKCPNLGVAIVCYMGVANVRLITMFLAFEAKIKTFWLLEFWLESQQCWWVGYNKRVWFANVWLHQNPNNSLLFFLPKFSP